MKVSPYLSFRGNCAEAVEFYGKVFNVHVEIMKYKDAPPSEGYTSSPDTENLVMHANMNLGNDMIMFCDTPPEHEAKIGENIAISVALDDIETAKTVFEKLKDGGKVGMELQETFWSKCFGMLTDKFGIGWLISLDEQK